MDAKTAPATKESIAMPKNANLSIWNSRGSV